MKTSYEYKTELAESVKNLIQSLADGYRLTITIIPEKSGGYSAGTVTSALSVDIGTHQRFVEQQTILSTGQVYLFPNLLNAESVGSIDS